MWHSDLSQELPLGWTESCPGSLLELFMWSTCGRQIHPSVAFFLQTQRSSRDSILSIYTWQMFRSAPFLSGTSLGLYSYETDTILHLCLLYLHFLRVANVRKTFQLFPSHYLLHHSPGRLIRLRQTKLPHPNVGWPMSYTFGRANP